MVEKEWVTVNFLEGVQWIGKKQKGTDKDQLRIDEARLWDDVALQWAREGKPGVVGKRAGDTRHAATGALMALYMDLRASEITQRICRDVDDGGTLLVIEDAKTPAGWGSQEIPETLQPLVADMRRGKAPGDYLLGRGKLARTRCYIRRWVARICEAAGVQRVSAHAMRRFHATVAVERGMTAHQIEIAMGHGKFQVTKDSYIKRGTIQKQQLRAMTDLLHGDRKPPASAPSTDGNVGDGEETPALNGSDDSNIVKSR